MMLPILLFTLYAAGGALLGRKSPVWGVALLIGVVAPTASLWWQIGSRNVATVLAFTLALLAASSLTRAAGGVTKETPLPRVRALVWATVATILAASVLSWSLPAPPVLAALTSSWSDALLSLSLFNPAGFAGQLHAVLIAITGPLLLLLVARTLRTRESRALFRAAIVAGAVLALASPVIQYLALNPWIRPDLRTEEGSSIVGLVGFFQDPHSYAAHLVMMLCFATGLALGSMERRDRRQATWFWLLAVGILAVLFYTNSRSGLVAAGVAVSLLLIGWLAATHRDLPTSARPVFLAKVTVGLMLILGIPLLATMSPTFRGAAYGALEGVASERILEPLRPGRGRELMSPRTARWEKALILIRASPLWGVGPTGVRKARVRVVGQNGKPVDLTTLSENTHNYYLQFGAEYGVLALLCFVALVASVFWATISAALKSREPTARGLLWGIAGAQGGILAFSLTSHPLLLAEGQAVFWSLSALGLAMAADSDDGPQVP